MSTPLLNEVLILATTDSLKVRQTDGGLGTEFWSPMTIDTWSICYAHEMEHNPHFKNEDVLDAIIRLGDHNEKFFDFDRGFLNNVSNWDEWRMFSWMEAAERISGDLDSPRLTRWRDIFVRFGQKIMADCKDMEHFDGAIPNHGIWNHALFYRIGRNYNRDDFTDMASLAFERILAGQTPDGCFREGGTEAGFPGSPVVMYNTVSLMAINMYFGFSKDPAAEIALEKGFQWWWNTLFPDFTGIPCFDCRNVHHSRPFGPDGPEVHPLTLPAYFFNKPEVRAYAEAGWNIRRDKPFSDVRKSPHTGPYHSQALGFIALQWDKIRECVAPSPPEWPELKRFVALEGGIRRRNGWHVGLSGIHNTNASSMVLPTWRLERQSLVSIWNEQCGFIVGSGNSLIQEQASTMTFYHNGAAHYLHSNAYLKTTPPLDTLHLGYGENVGAVSVDTTRSDRCRVTFSMLGEEGKRNRRGLGHPASAMAARGRLPLQLERGNRIHSGGRSWTLAEETGLRIRINAGETLDCGAWSLHCDEGWWDFIWPLELSNAYNPLFPAAAVALAEVALWTDRTLGTPRPTATFTVTLDPRTK